MSVIVGDWVGGRGTTAQSSHACGPPPGVAAAWHPKLFRFFGYWQAIRPATGLPGRKDFDPTAIGDLLPAVWLLDVQRQPLRLRYRLVGTRIVAAIGREVTGLWLDEAHCHIAGDAGYVERYGRVVETGVPNRRRGQTRLWKHDDYREIENLIVPFAADGRTVDILAVLTVLHRTDGSSL